MLDKYFDLSKDTRFPMTLDNIKWIPLSEATHNKRKTKLTVYCLKCLDKIYIGTDSRDSRPYEHRVKLIGKKHGNHYIQRTFNKYSLELFYYGVLCEIPDKYITFRDQIENSYIRLFDTFKNGMNLAEFADTPALGRVCSDLHKKNLSNALKGRKLSKDHCRKNKNSQKHKLIKLIDPDGKVVEHFGLLDFARKYNLHRAAVGLLESGKLYNFKGWRKYDDSLIGKPFDSKENWLKKFSNQLLTCFFLSPKGKKISVTNLREFCQKNELDTAAMHRVWNRKAKTHKEWRRYEE
jgi:hypothetical protein